MSKKLLALGVVVVAAALMMSLGGKKEAPVAPKAAVEAVVEEPAVVEEVVSATVFPEMTWKFATTANETSNWLTSARKFGDIISEKTGGAVTLQYYPADQLTAGGMVDGIQALMDGTSDLSMHSNINWSAFDTRFTVVSLPFLFSNTDEVDAVLDGAGGEALRKILEENYNVRLLGIAENGFRHITNNKRPIEKMADLRALKIRVAGSQLLNRCYQLWGVDFSNSNWSEVFTALQTGTFDGQENPLPTADSASIQEVQKYLTYWTGTYDCVFLCINKGLYDSLSPELQAIVDEAGKEAVLFQRELNRQEDREIIERWAAKGIEITYLSEEAAQEFKEVSAPVYQEFADRMTPELIQVFTQR